MIRKILYVSSLCLVGVAQFICDTPAQAFSLGIRPYAGLELATLPGTKLVDAEDPTIKRSNEQDVKRNFVFYGGELAVTPVQMGALSVSALVGFRMMSSATTSGLVNDTLSMSYVPVGASVDFAISKLRLSGLFTYDLGLSPKFILSVQNPSNTLDLQMAKLSRLRFGALGEFFVMPALSVFGMFDYATGSFEIASGPLSIFSEQANEEIKVSVVGGKNKLSAMTFGGGIAYYIPPPKSQRTKVEQEPKSSGPASKKKPAGKGPAKKGNPKAGGAKSKPKP